MPIRVCRGKHTVRYVIVAGLIPLAAAGCAAPVHERVDPAQRQWDETSRRFRSEVMLVSAAGGWDGQRVRPCPDAEREGQRACPCPDAAREYTFAIRVRRGPASDATAARKAPAHCSSTFPEFSPGSDVGAARTRGTGIAIDAGGLILTNEHVVHAAQTVEVRIAGRGWIPARVLQVDPQSDLAVIRVDAALPRVARFADPNTAEVGSPVTAIGFAAGRESEDGPAAFAGRLLARSRCLQGALDPSGGCFYADLLETAAAILPGCSGGPLVNGDGHVIGINTASAVSPDTGRRCGYAIPLTGRVRAIVDTLARGEAVRHGYLGLLIRRELESRRPGGVEIERVVCDSPAQRAGLLAGDRVIGLDGVPIATAVDLAHAIRGAKVGNPIRVQILRNGRSESRTAIPAALPLRAGAP